MMKAKNKYLERTRKRKKKKRRKRGGQGCWDVASSYPGDLSG